ncbi:MAG TPA: Uma2 family endonuclease [Yinghuangia sp.]|nr:Uma2 family endonuclease [Yinghuangia sp.]
MTLIAEEARTVVRIDTDEDLDVQAFFETFEPPAGFRAELIEGAIVLSPTPVGRHGFILDQLYDCFLDTNRPEGTAVPRSPLTISLPEMPEGNMYIPDLAVVDEAVRDEDHQWKFPASVFHLVVEVVSRSSKRDDRFVKPMGYASGPVPLFLLIDPENSHVTLYCHPEDGKYRAMTRVAFGGKIPFPEPFGGVLDTSIFIR